MKILLTGASGFLGREILHQLASEEIITLGRSNSDLCFDLTQTVSDLPKSDVVVHCAGMAHVVPRSDMEKKAFFDINANGTKNLTNALTNLASRPKSFILISTVAVYGKESGNLINESSELAAKDPYGQSKIDAEEIVQNWCKENDVICTIFRLPLIAGVNPPGNLLSMINGIRRGYYFNVAGGAARRSMVLAKDVAEIIPRASLVGGIFNLTDGVHPSFSELANLISGQLGKSRTLSIPFWLAKFFAIFGDKIWKNFPIDTRKLNKMITDLTYDDLKARQFLKWDPKSVLKEFKI